jgi:hypothetical protein
LFLTRLFIGGLVLASIDQVPGGLIDNAIVIGCLSFFVAFVFLIDLSEKMGKRRTDATQTDTNSIDRHNKSQSMTTLNSQANLMESDVNGSRIRESMRSTVDGNVQQSLNPFVTTETQTQDQGFHSMHSTQQHFQPATYTEDVVETQTLPTAQLPVFSKVKQPPVTNHLETEAYKKILSRQSQIPANFTRYHDTSAQLHHDPSFYDDFNNYRKQTYYQGPKVDQGKFVIRDYSHEPKHGACNCTHHEEESAAIKAGYVSQVAKIWDDRMKSNQGSVRNPTKEIRGQNTIV